MTHTFSCSKADRNLTWSFIFGNSRSLILSVICRSVNPSISLSVAQRNNIGKTTLGLRSQHMLNKRKRHHKVLLKKFL